MSQNIPPFASNIYLKNPITNIEELHPAWRKWFQDLGTSVTNITTTINIISGGVTNNYATLTSSLMGSQDYVAEEPFFINGPQGPQGIPGPSGVTFNIELDQQDTLTEASGVVNFSSNPYYNSISQGSGSATAPSLNYGAALTTGLYWANPGIGYTVAGSSIGTMTATGLNGMAVGATTASTGAFTTLSASGNGSIAGTLVVGLSSNPTGSPLHVHTSTDNNFEILNPNSNPGARMFVRNDDGTTTTNRFEIQTATTTFVNSSGTDKVTLTHSNGNLVSAGLVQGATLTASSGIITPSYPSGIAGSTGASATSAGSLGEIIDSGVVGGSTLSTGVITTLASISLTAGVWHVVGSFQITLNGAAITEIAGWVGTSTSVPALFADIHYDTGSVQTDTYLAALPEFVRITSTTTYYIVGFQNGSLDTTVSSRITAVRIG